MSAPATVLRAFEAVDAKDGSRVVTFLTPDAVFRYGNAPPITGHDATREAVARFFDAVKALRHDLLDTWTQGEMVFCKGEVSYTRHDGSGVGPLPFFNLFKMRCELIAEYLIYVDITPLFAPRL